MIYHITSSDCKLPDPSHIYPFLKQDKYVESGLLSRAGLRFIKDTEGNFVYDKVSNYSNKECVFLYELSENTNTELDGVKRVYPGIPDGLQAQEISELAGYCARIVDVEYQVNRITAQIISYAPTKNKPAHPTPRTIHHDEVEFTSVSVIDLNSVNGGNFYIADRSAINSNVEDNKLNNNIFIKTKLSPKNIHTVLFNDSLYGHSVSKMIAENEKACRTVLLIDYLR